MLKYVVITTCFTPIHPFLVENEPCQALSLSISCNPSFHNNENHHQVTVHHDAVIPILPSLDMLFSMVDKPTNSPTSTPVHPIHARDTSTRPLSPRIRIPCCTSSYIKSTQCNVDHEPVTPMFSSLDMLFSMVDNPTKPPIVPYESEYPPRTAPGTSILFNVPQPILSI